MIDGKFVAEGLTQQERPEHYVMCQGLVMQCVHHGERKAFAHPAWRGETLFGRVEEGIRSKRVKWDLSGAEVDWIVTRVRAGDSKANKG